MARKTTNTTKTPTRKKSTARKESPAIRVKQQKPVFGTSTWVTVLLLAILIGFTFYLKREKENTTAEATPASSELIYIFPETSGTLVSVEIKTAAGETVKVARNAEKTWEMILPQKAEADQGLAEAAATQVSALQVITSIEGNPSIFGFSQPDYIITIEVDENGTSKIHTLEIGDPTPTHSGYYARVDKDKMMVTNLSGVDALIRLVSAPPYLNTPAPEISVTPTP